MVKMSGGEALTQSLVREGVEVVFGIPGIHVSGILAAIRDEPSIRMVYNAASGLATAYARSSPVLLIAGQIPRAQIGKNLGAYHEVADQSEMLRSVTK